ncbi:MAG: DoxX family protein [Burkholderiales bacterium]|nr:DoxX family protein [Burkholderiales bacterium]
MASKLAPPPHIGTWRQPARLVQAVVALLQRLPDSLIALLARFSIAAVFWKSGQTKVQGFALDIVCGDALWGWPHLSDSAVALFADEYRLPLLPPELAATMAALGEHVFPVLLLFGLATRFSALALLGMTLVIQFLVFPGGYPTHGTWVAVLLWLMARGPGIVSVDHVIAKRFG